MKKVQSKVSEFETLLDINRAAKLAVLEREYINRSAKIEAQYRKQSKALEISRNIMNFAIALVNHFGAKHAHIHSNSELFKIEQ